MRPAFLRASLSLAALAAASLLASCASPTAQAEAEARVEAERIAAEIALRGPPVALNQSVADSAAAFVEPISDNKGTEAYKRSLLKGLVKRAFEVVERRRRGETDCRGRHR